MFPPLTTRNKEWPLCPPYLPQLGCTVRLRGAAGLSSDGTADMAHPPCPPCGLSHAHPSAGTVRGRSNPRSHAYRRFDTAVRRGFGGGDATFWRRQSTRGGLGRARPSRSRSLWEAGRAAPGPTREKRVTLWRGRCAARGRRQGQALVVRAVAPKRTDVLATQTAKCRFLRTRLFPKFLGSERLLSPGRWGTRPRHSIKTRTSQ
jgi:hypothetical protein